MATTSGTNRASGPALDVDDRTPATTGGGAVARDRSPHSTTARWGWLVSCIWLLLLAQPFSTAIGKLPQLVGWTGLVGLLGFAALYVLLFRSTRSLFRTGRQPSLRVTLPLLGGMVALSVVTVASVGQSGTSCVYFVVVSVMLTLPSRVGWLITAAISIALYVLEHNVEAWHVSIFDTIGVLFAALAMWGMRMLGTRTRDLEAAKDENRAMAVEEERNRISRDLHDLIGHSLTVLSMKAELASRLVDTDPARARREMDEVQQLARSSLTDVRDALSNVRTVTLAGEIARATAALRAADIEADMPTAVDDVPGERRELFAWAIREGTTNVLRHSAAARCVVTVSRDRVEVRDDGHGVTDAARLCAGGNGLAGLRERAAAAGASLRTRNVEPHGFALEVVAR